MHRKITALFLFLILALANLAPAAMAGGYGFPKKAEDSAAASGDDLCVQGAVIKNSNDTALAADGDYTVPTCNDVGNLKVQVEPTRKATYVCISPKFTPIASATDMWEIYGSSTKTVKILQIDVCFTSGSLVSNEFYLIKRSTANSSGTPTTPTIVALDSNNSAATAVVKHYASGSNPTLGTAVGNVCAVTAQPTFSATYQLSHSIEAGYQRLFDAKQAGQPLTLRGTSQGVALNNNGVTLPGSGQIAVRVIWTEE